MWAYLPYAPKVLSNRYVHRPQDAAVFQFNHEMKVLIDRLKLQLGARGEDLKEKLESLMLYTGTMPSMIHLSIPSTHPYPCIYIYICIHPSHISINLYIHTYIHPSIYTNLHNIMDTSLLCVRREHLAYGDRAPRL